MVENLTCPGCGAPQSVDSDRCKYCKRPIVVRTLRAVAELDAAALKKYAASYNKQLGGSPDSAEIHASLAMCYMKLGLYDRALPHISDAIDGDPTDSDLYMYRAACVIGGSRPFLHSRREIAEAERYLDAALKIEDKGIYYFLKTYIRYDYYERKSLSVEPDYRELIAAARAKGVSKADVTELFSIMGQDIPADMMR